MMIRTSTQPLDWPAFLRQHDLHFEVLPPGWQEAPHFGNAMVGSMLYRRGGHSAWRSFARMPVITLTNPTAGLPIAGQDVGLLPESVGFHVTAGAALAGVFDRLAATDHLLDNAIGVEHR